MPDDAIVEVREVGKTYEGGVEALRNVNLGFPRGRLSTLLGPSGCGKTTLLKIIAGLIKPNAGEVWVKGRKVELVVYDDRLTPSESESGVHFLSRVSEIIDALDAEGRLRRQRRKD